MFKTIEGLSPLAAYEELMRFAKKRGEGALRLALHASVPQDFQPELLHLLKRNFVPEAADDATAEADVLFAPFCEDMGRGYFRFDPGMRSLLLDNLASNYSSDSVPRVRRVANFLLSYVEHFDRVAPGSQDPLWRDYLEIQRWVALAFLDPEFAAGQLAAALVRADSGGDLAARIQLGGLASALSTPLGGYYRLLNYTACVRAGGMADALSRQADEAFGELSAVGRKKKKKIFKGLIEVDRGYGFIRRPSRLSVLCDLTGAGRDGVLQVVEAFRREGRSFLTLSEGASP